MNKLLTKCLLASIALPAIATATITTQDSHTQEVVYHNTFPLSSSPTYDTLKLGTEYSNTVIMSNTIAGVMYGQLIKQKYPDLKFNKDYLYGSLIGQLMQESDMTTQINTNFKPNDPDQLIQNQTYAGILLSPGQGGPYQINDYSKRLPSAEAEGALGLVNYNSVAKILGYSIENQDNGNQTKERGPLALYNIYAGPMITAFYHFNDINRMNVNSTNSWYTYNEQWKKCLAASQDPNNTGKGLSFPFVMNVVYNAGDYSPVLKTYLDICANPEKQAQYNNMNNWQLSTLDYQNAIDADKPSTGDATYYRYPRQVSFYTNQIFNNNNAKLEKTGLSVNNEVEFSVARLKEVFGMVMHKMSYRDSNDNLEFIPVSVANSAFDQALNQVAKTKGEIPAELDFSNTTSYKNKSNSQRQIIYSVLEKAIQNLSANESISFADTYDAEPSPTPPGPTPKPLYTYPDGIGKYVNGTVVKDGDSNYQCLVANWCNTPAYSPTGSFADSAWKNLNPQPEPTPQGDWSPKKTYNEGDTVSIKSIEYRANFWNQNNNPENYNCQYGCEWTIFN